MYPSVLTHIIKRILILLSALFESLLLNNISIVKKVYIF